MSQEDVFNILKDLKGKATGKQIRDLAKKKYPSRTLFTYTLNRLKKLEINGKVIQEGEIWRIKKRNGK